MLSIYIEHRLMVQNGTQKFHDYISIGGNRFHKQQGSEKERIQFMFNGKMIREINY